MHPCFREDLAYWFQVDVKLGRRLLRIVEEVIRDPFSGIGKPEPLRQEAGTWSRRLTDEHRVTYSVTPDHVDFLQARFHYDRR